MAFRSMEQPKRRISLMGLIDVIFLLLIFFLVTSIVQPGMQEHEVRLPTPTNERGKANVLIQIVEPDQFVYLDWVNMPELIPATYINQPALAGNTVCSKLKNDDSLLIGKTKLHAAITAMFRRLLALEKADPRRMATCQILVRSPGDLPYSTTIELLDFIQDESERLGLEGVSYCTTEGDRGSLPTGGFTYVDATTTLEIRFR